MVYMGEKLLGRMDWDVALVIILCNLFSNVGKGSM